MCEGPRPAAGGCGEAAALRAGWRSLRGTYLPYVTWETPARGSGTLRGEANRPNRPNRPNRKKESRESEVQRRVIPGVIPGHFPCISRVLFTLLEFAQFSSGGS